MSIVRVVHNRENPYVQLNKEALRNSNLSLKATGLWARCMSRPDNWEFKIVELIKTCKEGKTAIYNIVNELIREGYAMRLEYTERHPGNRIKTNHTQYIFFEFPPAEEEKQKYLDEFKKSFRHPDFPDPGFRDTGTEPLLNKEDLLTKVNKEATKERSACAPVPPLFSKPRKRVKEAKEAKADRVLISPSQHQDLLKLAEGDEALVQTWYNRLSRWKIGKEMEGGNNDYRSIINWTIKAVKEDQASESSNRATSQQTSDLSPSQKQNWEKNLALVNQLKVDCPNKAGGLKFFYKNHVLYDTNNRNLDISALIDHRDFCLYLQRKLGIDIMSEVFPNEI